MYDYNYYYETGSSAATGALVGALAVYYIFILAVYVFELICMWKVFKKAGRKGWEAIIPIYNIIVMLQIAELPTWYIVLFLIPFANIYAVFKTYIELAHKFNKSSGFGVGLVFLTPIFFAILAFEKNNEYAKSPTQVAQPSEDDKFCSNCGKKLLKNEDFCANCGTKVE